MADKKILDKRPNLSTDISSGDFKNYYWLKEELQSFCRKYGLKTCGGKIEITKRISEYLHSGKIVEDKEKQIISSSEKQDYNNLSRETIITSDFKCTQQVRIFFKSVIGEKFHFSVGFQKYCKNNVGKTFNDAINYYFQEQENKKSKDYKTTIDSQFEYNTYIRDFFEDKTNNTKTIKEAITCWKYKKGLRGSNKYQPSDLNCLNNKPEE